MSKQPDRMIAGLTSRERDYIRGELDMVFSTLPSVAEGFHLKTWRGGPEAGKPKLPLAAKGLLARGQLARLRGERPAKAPRKTTAADAQAPESPAIDDQ